MTKKIFLFVILAGLSLSACQMKEEPVYSCNPTANEWAKQNIASIRNMTRANWLKIHKESYRKAAFVGMEPNAKQQFWLDKLDATLKLDWTVKEREHLENLRTFVLQNGKDFENGLSDNSKIFSYKWAEYAMNELKWSKELILNITMQGENLLNTQGDLQYITKPKTPLLKNASDADFGAGSSSTCECHDGNVFFYWCDGASYCGKPDGCDETSSGCGFMLMEPCDGSCRPK